MIRQGRPDQGFVIAEIGTCQCDRVEAVGTQLMVAFDRADQVAPDAGRCGHLCIRVRSLWIVGLRVAANPDDFDAHVRLDGALAVQRRFPEIIAMWDGYVARQPREGRAYYERGGAKHHAGQRGGAIADLRKACELGFDPACTNLHRLGAR